jgi:hypothetical protein
MDPITLLAAFAPLAVDLGKSLIAKFVAPDTFKPATIEQYTEMKKLDLEMFNALNNAGGTNPSYLWVEAIVRMQRPLVAFIALATWCWSHTYGVPSPEVDNFAAVIGFYLFGDRTLFYAKNGVAK